MKKKKTKRTDVPVTEVVAGGLPNAELQKALEKEYEMALQDRVMEETKDKKNAVEAYVYDMRNKVLFAFFFLSNSSNVCWLVFVPGPWKLFSLPLTAKSRLST